MQALQGNAHLEDQPAEGVQIQLAGDPNQLFGAEVDLQALQGDAPADVELAGELQAELADIPEEHLEAEANEGMDAHMGQDQAPLAGAFAGFEHIVKSGQCIACSTELYVDTNMRQTLVTYKCGMVRC
jgi:hypothetical protein